MLEIHEITKQFEDKQLLKDISFQVEKEEVICLLGPSGSGKTTLLKIIAGLEVPESGQVLWQGKDLADVPAHRRNFGLMFQDYALFPHLTVYENVAFGMRVQGWEKLRIDDRVTQTLKMVHMSTFSDRSVTDLSGGEQQRVAFARAIAPNPKLLMLDEPMGALDRSLRDQLTDDLHILLRSLKVPTIYVTHDQEEAYAIADRIIILHEGVIKQDESAEAVYRNPANLWVASFLGNKNQIAGNVIRKNPLRVHTDLGEFDIDCEKTEFDQNDSVILIFRSNCAVYKEKLITQNRIYGVVEDVLFRGGGFTIKLRSEKNLTFSFRSDRPFGIKEKVNFYFSPENILCFKLQ